MAAVLFRRRIALAGLGDRFVVLYLLRPRCMFMLVPGLWLGRLPRVVKIIAMLTVVLRVIARRPVCFVFRHSR